MNYLGLRTIRRRSNSQRGSGEGEDGVAETRRGRDGSLVVEEETTWPRSVSSSSSTEEEEDSNWGRGWTLTAQPCQAIKQGIMERECRIKNVTRFVYTPSSAVKVVV
jgi:hypothetical protein